MAGRHGHRCDVVLFAFACSPCWILAGDVCYLAGVTPGKGLGKDDRNNQLWKDFWRSNCMVENSPAWKSNGAGL